MQRSYSWFPLMLLWFGASLSVAEIYTGGLLVSAGVTSGVIAIFFGHLLGVILLALMARIGYKEGLPSLACTRIAFGQRGSWILSVANVMQLLGWTAVMMQQNSIALGAIVKRIWGVDIIPVIIVGMGFFIALWSFWESKGSHHANTIAVLLLGGLAVLVTWTLWGNAHEVAAPQPPFSMSLGEAFDLSLIMPLSWVPLVADYAWRAKNARTASLAPALGYFLGSIWMYGVGFTGALLTGESSPTPMLLAAGLSLVAIGVLAISTIVTTFLDVYSAVASVRNISPKIPERLTGLVVVVIGTTTAIFWDSAMFMFFLECIGAVFAPLSAILFTDYYLLHVDNRTQAFSLPSLLSLAVGILSHILISHFGGVVGPTMGCLTITFVFHIACRLISKKVNLSD